ncbi:MAG: hypothetical protein KKA79_09585 [Nanoarchaeota archaeon]|nr:hypothetical protein [Nanoarchaeota archaeon]
MGKIHTKYHEKGYPPEFKSLTHEIKEGGALEIKVKAEAGSRSNSIEKIKLYRDGDQFPIREKEDMDNCTFNYQLTPGKEYSFYLVIEDEKGNFAKYQMDKLTTEQTSNIEYTQEQIVQQDLIKEKTNLEEHIIAANKSVKSLVFFDFKDKYYNGIIKKDILDIRENPKHKAFYLRQNSDFDGKWKDIEGEPIVRKEDDPFDIILGFSFENHGNIKYTEIYRNGIDIEAEVVNGKDSFSYQTDDDSNGTWLYHALWKSIDGQETRSKDIIIHNEGRGDNLPRLTFGYNKKKNVLVMMGKDSGKNADIDDFILFRNGKKEHVDYLIGGDHPEMNYMEFALDPKAEDSEHLYHLDKLDDGLHTFHAYISDNKHHKVISDSVTLKKHNGTIEYVQGETSSQYNIYYWSKEKDSYMVINKDVVAVSPWIGLGLVGIIAWRGIRRFFKKRGLRKNDIDLLQPEEILDEIEEKVTIKPKKEPKKVDWSKNIWDLMNEGDKDEPPRNRW